MAPRRGNGGRKPNDNFKKLEFTLIKNGSKYRAMCNLCKKELMNTCSSRLQSHRNVCFPTKKLSQETIFIDDSDVSEYHSEFDCSSTPSTSSASTYFVFPPNNDIQECEDLSQYCVNPPQLLDGECTVNQNNENINNIDTQEYITEYSERGDNDINPRINKKNKNVMSTFIDKLTKGDEERINEALSGFFFGCNIPFAVIDSVYFKNLIKTLRPSYAEKIPTRRTLSTTLLNNCYNKCIAESSKTLVDNSVLLVDGWKNSSANRKTVVTMIHNINGTQSFVNAYDLSTESETAEKLAEIVLESCETAKELYKTNIYAVVSDNASAMIKMGHLTSHIVWHSTCNSHTGNLLAKDVTNKKLNDEVLVILKEFKHCDLEKKIIDYGGTRIKLPCDTRWCSNRDSYMCLIKNLKYMKKIIAEGDVKKKIKSSVSQLIFNDEFINDIQEHIELYNPICTLINCCQNSKFSVADATAMWLDLDKKFPKKFIELFRTKIENRKKMALNEFALAAFFLHPFTDNNRLDKTMKENVYSFMFRHLDGKGIEELDSFIEKKGIFETLYDKELTNAIVFWKMCKIYCPNISQLAIKLLNIPASSAQLERIFSSWALIHTPIRNRLTFEKSKKLMHVYYALKIKDTEIDIDDEVEE